MKVIIPLLFFPSCLGRCSGYPTSLFWSEAFSSSLAQSSHYARTCDQRISYLNKLYSAGLNHLIGALWKGFDNNDASWGSNWVIAQQCGQVLLKTANKMSKHFGGSIRKFPMCRS